MGLYDLDINEQVRQDLPTDLRKSKRLTWLRVLVYWVRTMYTEFKAFRGAETGTVQQNSILYKLSHSGQVCKLEGALNDAFDEVGRGIYITDGEFDDAVSLYLVPEEKPVWLATEGEGAFSTPYTAPLPLYTETEATTTGTDFIVHVPAAVAAAPGYNVDRLKAIVKYYKLLGKRFTVVVEP